MFQLVSLICLAEVLRRALGKRVALIPLVAMGLSPTLLYLNSIQTSYGIDLQYLPICLLMIVMNRYDASMIGYALSALLGITTMIACMSFPTPVLLLPALAAFVLLKIWRGEGGAPAHSRGLAIHAVCLLLGLIAPFAFALLWLENPGTFLYDPATNAGIFRGGGASIVGAEAFMAGLKTTLRDLLVEGGSYHFELRHGEFSWAGIAPLLFVLAASAALLARDRELRPAVLVCWGIIALSLALPCFAGGCPGLRRCTGTLVGYYALYALVWRCLDTFRPSHPRWAWAGIAICLLLPLHSVMTLPANCASAAYPSLFRENVWLGVKDTPEESVDFLLSRTEKGEPLVLLDDKREVKPCRYAEIYATLSGWRRWNGRSEIPLSGFDTSTGRYVQLTPRLWDAYGWPH